MTRLKISALAMVGLLGTSIGFAQMCDCCTDCDGECSSCFSAYLDMYYLTNWNHPSGGYNSEGRAYDIFNANPSIAEISARWHKAAGDGMPFGINVELYGGRNADLDHEFDPAGSKYKAVKQAFLSFGGGKWGVDVGKFNTWFGKENRSADHNINYSRSLQYFYLQPVFGTGARAWFDVNDNLKLGVAGVLGWNESEDSNSDMSFGAWLGYKGSKFNAKVAMYSGQEGADSGPFGGFYALDFVVDVNAYSANFDFKLGEKATLGFEGTSLGIDDDGSDYTMTGLAGYLQYDWSEKTTFGFRFEQLEDEDGWYFPSGEELTSYTINVDCKTGDRGKVRFEYRSDKADSEVFDDGESKRETWSVSYQVRIR